MKLKNFVSFHLTLCRAVYEYIVPGFQPKPAVFRYLTNAIAPPPIALKSCSSAQMDQSVL